jgi:hypothetical protein
LPDFWQTFAWANADYVWSSGTWGRKGLVPHYFLYT